MNTCRHALLITSDGGRYFIIFSAIVLGGWFTPVDFNTYKVKIIPATDTIDNGTFDKGIGAIHL